MENNNEAQKPAPESIDFTVCSLLNTIKYNEN
jgi:hypothetical protein